MTVLSLALLSWSADPGECSRDGDFSDWPGGRALRLDIGEVALGSPVSFTVTGALPSERLVLYVGSECGLDCPAELDGACFQPAGAVEIAEIVTDAGGGAYAELTLPAGFEDQWVVLQATAPDRVDRALSEAVVVRNGDGWSFGEYGEWRELSPLMVIGLSAANREYWWWPVASGRRVQLVNNDEPDDTDCFVVVDSVILEQNCWDPGAADAWFAGPSAWYFTTYDGDWVTTNYNLDIRTVPTDLPVDWYPDLDGDGYGDPLGTPIASVTPVRGASPDRRDCDDTLADVRPLGNEICDDGRDQDCDGLDRQCRETPGVTEAPGVGTRIVGERFAIIGADLTTGDLDGDGSPDLVTGGEDGHTYVLPITRRDDAPLLATIARWGGVAAVGDFTGDGQADLVRSDGGGLAFYPGPLEGDLPEADATLLDDEAYVHPSPGDVNGDGIADLLVASFNGGRGELHAFVGPFLGERTEPDAVLYPVDGGLTRFDVELSDVDGDGLDDIWTHEVCVHLSPVPALDSIASGCVDDGRDDNMAWAGLVAADANGDGYGDLVTGDAVGVRLLLGPLTGTSSVDDGSYVTVEVDSDCCQYRVGAAPDRDENGLIDLLVAVPSAVWSISAVGPGTVRAEDGTRLFQGDKDINDSPSVLGGDFDADGLGDVVVVERGASHDSVYEAGVGWILWGDGGLYVPPIEGEDDPPVDDPDPTDPPDQPSDDPAARKGCGCNAAPSAGWIGLVPLLLGRRTRRPRAGR